MHALLLSAGAHTRRRGSARRRTETKRGQSVSMCAVLLQLLLVAVRITATSANFAATAELPDLLTMSDGRHIETAEQWHTQRRPELKALVQEHILGTLPPENPTVVGVTALNFTNITGGGIASTYLRLAFKANGTAVEFDIELAWPTDASGELPLFLTQWNHRSWGVQAVQRGYMMVLYPGADTRDASGHFRAAYPGCSMRKILARAFVASRTLDVLLAKGGPNVHNGPKLPAIDQARVAITGHSRNGKQSLIAAAFDERISAVVGSSPGAPVAAPVRFSSPDFNGETTKFVSDQRDWWLPSLRTYLGREHELPADGHMILALIAPRYVMLATARSDGEGDVSFADEQNVIANLPVWKLLGSTSALRIKWREGRHHGFDDPQTYVDWFDFSSGTGPSLDRDELPHAWNWSAWRERSLADTPPPPPPSAPLADRIRWMLGSGSATTTSKLVGGYAYCESGAVGNQWDYKAALMMHDSFRECRIPSRSLPDHEGSSGSRSCPHSVTRIALSFGAYITASLFVPCASTACEELEGKPPLPVVIFLHGYSYQLGYTGTTPTPMNKSLNYCIYGLYESDTDGGLIPALVGQLGVAVLAWDMPGHGARQTEGPSMFYRRYQHASRLGAMVGEVESALHMIHCAAPSAFDTLPECSDGELFDGTYKKLRLPPLDERRIYLMGYSMGSNVALHAAALLPQIAGVAAFGGWSPFEQGRNASSVSVVASGGNPMIYSRHALLPRLGLFSEALQAPLPYDYAELIAEIAPRPILLYAPTGNRFALPGAVATAVQEASKAWRRTGASTNFSFLAPETPSNFASEEISTALRWVKQRVL